MSKTPRRLLQTVVAILSSGIMLAALVGFSAAAPDDRGNDRGNGRGNANASERSRGNEGTDTRPGVRLTSTPSSAGVTVAGATVTPSPRDRDDRGARGDDRPVPASQGTPDADDRAGGTRPGFGCGDDNHEHTGPPGNGPSFNPCTHGERGEEGSATVTVTPATDTATPTPTGTPATATPTPTGTPPTATATVTGTPPTATPTATGTPPTATPTGTATATPTVTSTSTATATATGTVTSTAVQGTTTTGGGLLNSLLHFLGLR